MAEGTDAADGDTEETVEMVRKRRAGEIGVWRTVTDSICTSKWTERF